MQKFDFWCFKPSNKALYNFVLYGFAIYGMYTVGIISLLMEAWHMVGHEILGLIVFYYMTFELFDFWEDWKINQFTKRLGEDLLKKFLYIDEKINADLFEEVDEQISCLSKNLQVLLMKLKVPEAKAKKITVKRAGLFLLKIPVYFVVILIIILWDIFYKNLFPAVWKVLGKISRLLAQFLGLKKLSEIIKKTESYKAFVKWSQENKIWARIVLVGFVLIFVSMEGFKLMALNFAAHKEWFKSIASYLLGTGLFFIAHPYLEWGRPLLLTINWFKIRYYPILSGMEIFEKTNSYKKVMAQLAKAKAVIKTVWKQFKAILSVIRQILAAYKRNLVNSLRQSFGLKPLEVEEEVSIIEEIKREHDSLWKGIRPYIKSVFDKIKTLEEEDAKSSSKPARQD